MRKKNRGGEAPPHPRADVGRAARHRPELGVHHKHLARRPRHAPHAILDRLGAGAQAREDGRRPLEQRIVRV